MNRVEYAKLYNHSSHLSDDVRVFRSDCEGCKRHLSEAFGPVIQRLIEIRARRDGNQSAYSVQQLVDAAKDEIENDNLYAATPLLIAALEVTGD